MYSSHEEQELYSPQTDAEQGLLQKPIERELFDKNWPRKKINKKT